MSISNSYAYATTTMSYLTLYRVCQGGTRLPLFGRLVREIRPWFGRPHEQRCLPLDGCCPYLVLLLVLGSRVNQHRLSLPTQLASRPESRVPPFPHREMLWLYRRSVRVDSNHLFSYYSLFLVCFCLLLCSLSIGQTILRYRHARADNATALIVAPALSSIGHTTSTPVLFSSASSTFLLFCCI